MTGFVGAIAASVNLGIPGIPLGALDAIADENTRQVLQAVVNGWHVRNGASGKGDAAFVTRSELVGATAQATNQALRNFNGFKLSPGEISRALGDLHTQVFESQLFRALEARVDLIDKPDGLEDRMSRIFTRMDFAETSIIEETRQRVEEDTALTTRFTALGTRMGVAETAISTEIQQRVTADTALSSSIVAMETRVGNAEVLLTQETQQRVNADNALQTTVNTQYASVNNNLSLLQQSTTTNANNVAALATTVQQIQASVGANSAAIAQEAAVRANADGDLYAQYTLRVDVNGRVSGFGLASGAKSSDFIIRADRFSLVSPDGLNKAALIMTNNTINVYDENGALRVRIGNLS